MMDRVQKGALCVFLIGPPASGKSSVCKWLETTLGFTVIQTGEMLRTETKTRGSVLGQFIKNNWNHESLGTVTENMLQRVIRQIPPTKPIVIDGYPRTIQQAQQLGNVTQTRVVCVIAIEKSLDLCQLHYMNRKRDGDMTQESLDIRWSTYEAQTHDIREILAQQQIYYQVNGSVKTIDLLCDQFKKWMDIAWNAQTILLPMTFPKETTYVEPIEAAVCIQLLMSSIDSTRKYKHFNGRHAVSLGHKNMQLLGREEYFVSVKIDGVRVMVVSAYDSLFMIDRTLNVKRLLTNSKIVQQLETTVLDCEWIEDIATLVIIDIPFFMNRTQVGRNLAIRMIPADEICLLISSHQSEIKAYPQKYWAVTSVDQVPLDKIPFKDDGYIFTPAHGIYSEGADYGLLKWKPTAKNSVDFLFDKFSLLALNGKSYKKYATLQSNEVPHTVKFGDIVECIWDFGAKKWKIARVRHDRNSPNPVSIVESVLETIQNPVRWPDLCQQPIHPPRQTIPIRTQQPFFRTVDEPKEVRPAKRRAIGRGKVG